jgi:hypothetical protein
MATSERPIIRIAPSFPELPEVEQAAEGVAVPVLLAAAEARKGRQPEIL